MVIDKKWNFSYSPLNTIKKLESLLFCAIVHPVLRTHLSVVFWWIKSYIFQMKTYTKPLYHW